MHFFLLSVLICMCTHDGMSPVGTYIVTCNGDEMNWKCMHNYIQHAFGGAFRLLLATLQPNYNSTARRSSPVMTISQQKGSTNFNLPSL